MAVKGLEAPEDRRESQQKGGAGAARNGRRLFPHLILSMETLFMRTGVRGRSFAFRFTLEISSATSCPKRSATARYHCRLTVPSSAEA